MGYATTALDSDAAIVCGPAIKPCVVCGAVAEYLCDARLRESQSRQRDQRTLCNAPVCAAHCRHVAQNRDLCPQHVAGEQGRVR